MKKTVVFYSYNQHNNKSLSLSLFLSRDLERLSLSYNVWRLLKAELLFKQNFKLLIESSQMLRNFNSTLSMVTVTFYSDGVLYRFCSIKESPGCLVTSSIFTQLMEMSTPNQFPDIVKPMKNLKLNFAWSIGLQCVRSC